MTPPSLSSTNETETEETEYDVIIVGAGVAGVPNEMRLNLGENLKYYYRLWMTTTVSNGAMPIVYLRWKG
jgi:pyruvate/2-oxoglutarate dehydrogenase complex dihydrolipoamide dehydrogenase (E3) component